MGKMEQEQWYCNCYLDENDEIVKCQECKKAEIRKFAREEFDAFLERRGLL